MMSRNLQEVPEPIQRFSGRSNKKNCGRGCLNEMAPNSNLSQNVVLHYVQHTTMMFHHLVVTFNAKNHLLPFRSQS